MDILSGVALARLGQCQDDGHQVMPRLLLEFLDALDGDPLRCGLPRDFGRRLLRDQPDLRLRTGEGRLDVQEALQPGLLFEEPLHLRPPVAEVDRAQEGHGHRRGQSPEMLWSFLPRPNRHGGDGIFGRTTVNVVPWPSADATSIVPPWALTTLFANARPRPVPCSFGFVVKNGWKSFSRTSAGMPGPVSWTRSATVSPWSSTPTVTAPFDVAWRAFFVRLTSTCWIRPGSTSATTGGPTSFRSSTPSWRYGSICSSDASTIVRRSVSTG